MTDTIKQVGTIKITNVDTGETTYSATYDAADIIAALNCGESLDSVIARLELTEESHEPASAQPNPFPMGM